MAAETLPRVDSQLVGADAIVWKFRIVHPLQIVEGAVIQVVIKAVIYLTTPPQTDGVVLP